MPVVFVQVVVHAGHDQRTPPPDRPDAPPRRMVRPLVEGVTMTTARLLTTRDIIELPDDDFRYELVRGFLIRRWPSGMAVGRSRASLCSKFVEYMDQCGGEATMMSGYEIERDPDTVLAPNVGFIR